jgi:hypothetical protein
MSLPRVTLHQLQKQLRESEPTPKTTSYCSVEKTMEVEITFLNLYIYSFLSVLIAIGTALALSFL